MDLQLMTVTWQCHDNWPKKTQYLTNWYSKF